VTDYICHYGILGQKWGIRRYQRKDGRLTLLGQRRFRAVSKNRKLQKKQTKRAIDMFEKETKKVSKKVKRYERKGEKYADKTNYYRDIENQLSTRLSDIKSGTMRAGRDFIVQSEILKVPYVYIFATGPRVATFDISRHKYIEKKR
jgi:hypothetical protein